MQKVVFRSNVAGHFSDWRTVKEVSELMGVSLARVDLVVDLFVDRGYLENRIREGVGGAGRPPREYKLTADGVAWIAEASGGVVSNSGANGGGGE